MLIKIFNLELIGDKDKGKHENLGDENEDRIEEVEYEDEEDRIETDNSEDESDAEALDLVIKCLLLL